MVRPHSGTKSNKDYCRKYREKNKEAFKVKEKERKKFARDYEKHVDREKYEARLKKDRLRSREYRKRKKEESKAVKGNTIAVASPVASPSSTSTSTLTSAFSCKQALSRSISRAEKNLPASPRKKTEIVGNLTKKYNMKINLIEGRGRKPKVLSKEQEKWLTEYLERPEMTYTNTGRKDNVYTGKIDGKKHYEQKRYLQWTLRDALGIVNNQEDGFYIKFQCDLSFAVFYRFIKNKKQFIFQRDIPDTSCLCEICEKCRNDGKRFEEGLFQPSC